MKTTALRLLALSAIFAIVLAACSKAKGPSPLEGQSQRLNTELSALADASPAFLDAIEVSYADATLSIDIQFSDSTLNVAKITEPLVQYVVAQYLKGHPGANLDEILNTLTQEKGSLAIKLTGADGATAQYTIGAARLRNLFKLRPMELGYNEVRTNVIELFESRCAAMAAQFNAESCEFDIDHSFAQYTFIFPSARAFASLNQASLTGRYVKILKAQYEAYGACRPIIEELLKSLSIDGYRFLYLTPDRKTGLTAGIPWRTIN
ncbi:MAG: hypothetical protein K2L28_04650 [Muribaculaceae bacterium]|nr:hypothetical protein [Muribaculaceae bacterium]